MIARHSFNEVGEACRCRYAIVGPVGATKV
jgi:hypothetical protein